MKSSTRTKSTQQTFWRYVAKQLGRHSCCFDKTIPSLFGCRNPFTCSTGLVRVKDGWTVIVNPGGENDCFANTNPCGEPTKAEQLALCDPYDMLTVAMLTEWRSPYSTAASSPWYTPTASQCFCSPIDGKRPEEMAFCQLRCSPHKNSFLLDYQCIETFCVSLGIPASVSFRLSPCASCIFLPLAPVSFSNRNRHTIAQPTREPCIPLLEYWHTVRTNERTLCVPILVALLPSLSRAGEDLHSVSVLHMIS